MDPEHLDDIIPRLSDQPDLSDGVGLSRQRSNREGKVRAHLRKISNPLRRRFSTRVGSKSTASYDPYPIDPKTEIRILELLPPALSDPDTIHCTLFTAKLKGNPRYDALSYAWGQTLFTERLCLPTGYLAITPSLAAALRSLRYLDRPRRIWVDAICINQQDDHEKGHQVDLMSLVYRKAQCTLAWLGEGTLESAATFAMLKDLGASAWKIGVMSYTSFIREISRILDVNAKAALGDLSKKLDIPAWSTILCLPWFKRLWIVQEAALPSHVQLCWGKETLDFQSFTLASIVIFHMYRARLVTGNEKEMNLLCELCAGRQMVQEDLRGYTNFEWSFLNQVEAYSSRACGNDLDRIFGLLGLRKSRDCIFEAEYGVTVEKAYLKFAFRCLKYERDLTVLHYAKREFDNAGKFIGHSQCQQKSAESPSWVPDWRLGRRGRILAGEGGFKSATKLESWFSLDRNNLPFIGVGGVKVDTVTAELSTILPGEEGLTDLRDIWRSKPWNIIKLRDWFLGAISSHLYHTGEHADNAFAKTMVMNNRVSYTKSFFPEQVLSLGNLWREVEGKYKNQTDLASREVSSGDWTPYERASQYMGWWRNFFMTESGYIGIGPFLIRPGDVVVVFDGDRTPFVLRSVEPDLSSAPFSVSSSERWEVVGECYLHGYMDNEVTRSKYDDAGEIFWIT